MMSNFTDVMLEKLAQMEKDQRVYDSFLQDRTRRKEDLQVVHMKAFFELIAFQQMARMVPSYIPGEFVGKKLAQELSTVGDFVTIVDGQVVIAPQYEEFLKLKAAYAHNNQKTNG